MNPEWIEKLDAEREAAKATASERAKELRDRDIIDLYLSGPMTGHREFNYPAFNETAARLRGMGFLVKNPAERFGGDTSRPRRQYMRWDIHDISHADAIAVLPGWRMSRGARLEVAVGRQIEMPILDAETLLPVADDESALEIVEVERELLLIEAAEEVIDQFYKCENGMTGVAMLRLAKAMNDAKHELALNRANRSGVEAIAQDRLMDEMERTVAA